MSNHSLIQQDILKALAYFNLFRYPLTAAEVTRFLNSPAEEAAVTEQLQQLLQKQLVYCSDGLYMLQNDPSMAERRRKGNLLAAAEMHKAAGAARRFWRFPYVRCIAVSGSLSKNYADESTDIDFFIITAAGRLWLARTLLHLQYKLRWPGRKRRTFCLNYYIDDAVPLIEEKNIFTATEIVTLVPLQGLGSFSSFAAANRWVLGYFPQHKAIDRGADAPPPLLKRLAETLLNNRIGSWLEHLLHRLTAARWQKKMERRALNGKGIPVSMKAGAHHAKPDPACFQQQVTRCWQQHAEELIRRLNEAGRVVV